MSPYRGISRLSADKQKGETRRLHYDDNTGNDRHYMFSSRYLLVIPRAMGLTAYSNPGVSYYEKIITE